LNVAVVISLVGVVRAFSICLAYGNTESSEKQAAWRKISKRRIAVAASAADTNSQEGTA
jgi:hypothetical protein